MKMHTLLDLHFKIPTFISITDGKVHDVNVLDDILPEAGAFYVMDRGYVDFERLYRFTLSSAFFVVRTKSNVLPILQQKPHSSGGNKYPCRPLQTRLIPDYDLDITAQRIQEMHHSLYREPAEPVIRQR